MSIINSIYNAPVVTDTTFQDQWQCTIVEIEYNGKTYMGVSNCAPEDIDFFSPKVGYNIALSRARMNAIHVEREMVNDELTHRRTFFDEASKYGKLASADIDPYGVFKQGIERLEERYRVLGLAEKREKKWLNTYLDGQAKALESIRKYRNKAKDN